MVFPCLGGHNPLPPQLLRFSTSSSKVFHTPFLPSRVAFFWNKQHCAIILLNVSSWPYSIDAFHHNSHFFVIFLFLVSGAKQEHSISDTDNKEPSEDDKGELKVDKLLVLVGFSKSDLRDLLRKVQASNQLVVDHPWHSCICCYLS